MDITEEEKALSIEEFLQLQSRVFHSLSWGGMAAWMDLDISLPQLKVLMLLYLRERATVSEVAVALHSSLPNITGLADRLVAQELVMRCGDPSDRRVVLLELSEKGREMLKRLYAVRSDIVQRVYNRLTPEERITVQEGMKLLMHAMEDESKLQEPGIAG